MRCVLPPIHIKGLIISFRVSDKGDGLAPRDQSRELALMSYTSVRKLSDLLGSRSTEINGILGKTVE